MEVINRLILTSILLSIGSCSLFFGSSERDVKKDHHYKIHFKDSGWKSIDPNESDFAFSHEEGDVLLSNSFCHEFQHESLDKLALKTIQSINQSKIIEGKNFEYKKREAYEALGSGNIDGVEIKLKIRNFRRDHCYYDFILISTELNQNSLKAFDDFTDSIEFK